MPQRLSIPVIILISAISLAGLASRIQIILSRAAPVGDETIQYVMTKERGFLEVWRNDMKFDDVTSFPGHYLFLYPFIKNYEFSNFAVRLPTLTMQILLFVLLYPACRPFYKTWLGFVIAYTIVAFNATLNTHALELRPYASLATLALISFYYADRIIRQEARLTLASKILCAFLFIFTCTFYAYGIFITMLPIFYQLIAKKSWRPQALRSFDASFLIKLIILSSLAWGWYAAGMIWMFIKKDVVMFLTGYDTFAYIPNPVTDSVGFIKSIVGNLMGRKELYFLLLGCGFWPFIEKKERSLQALFLIVLVILPVSLSCLSSLLSHYVFVQRHFSWGIPFFAVFIGWLWDSFFFSRFKINGARPQ